MDGVVLDNLESILRKRPEIELVCVMLANNETGVLQPIEKISLITKKLALGCILTPYKQLERSTSIGKP